MVDQPAHVDAGEIGRKLGRFQHAVVKAEDNPRDRIEAAESLIERLHPGHAPPPAVQCASRAESAQ